MNKKDIIKYYKKKFLGHLRQNARNSESLWRRGDQSQLSLAPEFCESYNYDSPPV